MYAIKYTEGNGERIRTLRRRTNITQQELGEKLGVSRQTINSYENERMVPPNYMIEKISDLFGVNPWWLLYGVGGPSTESVSASATPDRMYLRSTEDELTDEQLTLINFLKVNKDAAKKLAKELLSRWENVD